MNGMGIRSCIILGGGIAGLTAADRLSREGIEVTLLERAPFLGGLARRVSFDGNHVDLGPHVIRAKHDAILNYYRELIGSDLEERSFVTKIFFQDALLSYPINPFEIARKLPGASLARCAIDLLKEKAKSKFLKRRPESYEEWAIQNYGQSLYEAFFGPLTEKVWQVEAAALDARFAQERFPPLSLRNVLFKLRPSLGYHAEDPSGQKRFYPKRGVHQFCEALIHRAKAQNARFLTGVDVTSIEEKTDAGVFLAYLGAQGEVQLHADYLISTIPLPALASVHRGLAANDFPSLSYRGIGFLYLCVPKDCRLPEAIVLSSSRQHPFTRVSDFSYFSRAVCAPGRNVICVEFSIGDTTKEGLKNQSREIIEKLQALGIIDLSRVHSTWIETARHVYPTYLKGYRKELNEFFDRSLEMRRLLCVGRQGLYSHINIDDVMWSAFKGAELLLSSPFSRDAKRKFYGRFSSPTRCSAGA